MKAMKKDGILIITSQHRWDDPRIFFKQARSLAKKYPVELHAPAKGNPFFSEGVYIVPMPLYGRRLLRPLNWLRLLYRGYRSQARVIHLHDPELLPVGFVLKYIGKKKLIYDVHEDFSATMHYKPWIPVRLRRFLAHWLGKAEKWFSRRANALVLAEECYWKLFTDTTVPKVGIYNYPLLDLIPKSTPYKLKNSPINIVYAGGISKPRGALQMVRALSLVNWHGQDFRLILIGPVQPPVLRNKIMSLAERLGLSENVKFTGLIPLKGVYSYYLNTDLGLALLHPEKNYVESMATKIFEYMAAGIPVLASNFPAWNKLLEESGCGLNVDPLNEKSIAAKIELMLNNPNRRRQFGNNGYQSFLNKYNWDLEEKKLLSLYKNMLLPETRVVKGD